MEMEQRAVAQRIIHAAAEQEAVLLDMSDDELDSDDEEYLADLQREIAELIVALTWVEPQDTKAAFMVSFGLAGHGLVVVHCSYAARACDF